MIFYIVYIVYIACVVILVLHFTQFLARRNLQWLVLVAPFAIFAVNILKYMKIIWPRYNCPVINLKSLRGVTRSFPAGSSPPAAAF